ncbi:MAG: universal stress protein [Chitinophagaceae bacterium]|nr:universal stress protein [Chitinophagaceae bacterium]
MKKFLVPIDFSETSLNAAKYAAGLVKGVADAHLILYHVYSTITLATLSAKDEGSRQKVSEQALEEVKKDLNQSGSLFISCVAEEGTFVENLSEYALSNKIDLIIMGITGSSRIKQVFMGTNTLNVVRNVNCPVMIIPPQASYKGVKNVVFTSDFKDVARTHPFEAIEKILDILKPHLEILNVDEDHYVELSEEYKVEKRSMEDRLGKYNPDYSFLRSYDFLDGISAFVEARDVDAIITLPKKHSFLSQLFKTSHTKALAYHSTIPIIAIPA